MNIDTLTIILGFTQSLILIAISPLITGIMRKIKARTQKRIGSSIFQPYYDLIKLMQKDDVVSDQSSWLFQFAPWVNFSAITTSALFIPIFIIYSPFELVGDFLLLIGLFGLARFFTILGGLDTASAFGGLGSSREMMLSTIIEPALFLTIFTISLNFGATNITALINTSASSQTFITPSLMFALISMFVIVLAESGRLPFDNPATHLELTMIHEAMILEYSGKRLAIIEWSQSIKNLILITLLINIFLPWGITKTVSIETIGIGLSVYFVKVIVIAIFIAFLETRVAKWRLFRIPDLITIAIASSMVGIVFFYI